MYERGLRALAKAVNLKILPLSPLNGRLFFDSWLFLFARNGLARHSSILGLNSWETVRPLRIPLRRRHIYRPVPDRSIPESRHRRPKDGSCGCRLVFQFSYHVFF